LHISLIAMIVSIFGFFDDLLNFRALLKLIFQIFIAIISVFSFEFNTFFGFENIPKVIQYATYVFFITWAMNAYNFLDGIDGYASVGILISSFFVLLLMSSNLPLEFIIFLVLILINVLAFILLNWPPAKIFMGDAGSLYLGYVFSIIIIYTIDRNFIALDFWLLSLSFYISDILITQILRIALLRKWYVGHRSHAYQNFARIHSHKAMLYVYTLFMFFWVLPLLVANMSYPDYSLFILIIGFLPSVIFSIKYGPLLSLD